MTVVTQVTDGVPSSSNTAILAVLQSIKETDVDVIWAGQSSSPFLTTLMAAGREMNKVLDASDRFNSLGVTEAYWSNGPTVQHYEQDELLRQFTVNGGLNNSAVTVILDSTVGLKKYDLLKVISGTTNEILWVVSVDSATQLTVRRGQGTSAADSIANDAVLLRFANAAPAGVVGVDDVKVLAEQRTNYVQKFLDTLSGNDYDDLRRIYTNAKGNVTKTRDFFLAQKIADHKKSLEYAALLGQKADKFSGDGFYMMEGVVELAKRGNQADYSSGLTKADLAEAIGEVCRYGDSSKKYAFCGTKAMAEIADLFDTNQYKTDGIKEYSVELSKFKIPNGQSVKFLQHPLFDDAGLSGHMLIVDMSQLQVIWAQGNGLLPDLTKGQTRILPRSTNSFASFNIDIVTYMSMKNKNARAHGLFKLATA
jgi:hypothetical protein